MPKDNKHKKLTQDMPLGARIGMNIMLAAAPPTLRRHAIRRLEAGQRPIRKTRAERQREWEMEQARRARNGEPRSDWTPQSRSPCPWDEDEGSDDESRDVSRNGDERSSMTTGYERIYNWSSQVPENSHAVEDNRTSVSTAWPGPQTDVEDEVAPSESISVVGRTPDPEEMYRRGRIAPSSRDGARRRSESTRWSQN
ncbi:hypothetical protein CEP52_014426 [Fusarium oligoseptatum]|uniref:Uncharacterized protein n=1 Tax=Fusarium oligoseptatum TaxID=2604345 RepID=A0A428SMA3_9HYPO|nr:hypothetical protein CEP52_014426 [Fusarium oligoseptatum]